MSLCPDCGVEITWAKHEETGEKIPIDAFATALDGDRYITTHVSASEVRIRDVPDLYSGYAFADHRVTCAVAQLRPPR